MDRAYWWGDGLRPIPPDVTLYNDRQLLSHVPSHLQLFVKPVGRSFWGLHPPSPLHYTYTLCTYLPVQVRPQQRRIFTALHINTTLIWNCNMFPQVKTYVQKMHVSHGHDVYITCIYIPCTESHVPTQLWL